MIETETDRETDTETDRETQIYEEQRKDKGQSDRNRQTVKEMHRMYLIRESERNTQSVNLTQ